MPNNPQTSEQMQKLTTSQDGIGRVSKLQPHSHFYIQGNNFTQDTNQQFGVVNDTQFRTTATVAFSGEKNIYALCMGTVFIQPQTGNESSKVNVILRPFKQPINGLNIKYIIYRGLNKTDFFTNDSKITGSETTGSGFVQYMWKQFNKFYDVDNGGALPASGFSSDFLGYPSPTSQLATQENNHLIDQYFFKITTFLEGADPVEDATTAYEFPIVLRGIQLGSATGTVGIDIVLNDGDYIIENDPNPFQINLEYARAASYVLDTATETDVFKKKLVKEACTKFIDIAAFYGLHANGVGKLFVDTEEAPKTAKADIAARLNGFNTKHNFYLYIQSNRQRSYNFYNNYIHSEANTNTIKIGATVDALTETTFGTNGWPIHVISQVQDPATENNTVTFQLTTDNYDEAALFMQIGELASPHEENFVRGINLLQQQPEDDTVEVDFNYTQVIQITTPAIGANTIAAFSQCIYEGKKVIAQDAININEKVFLKDIDDVFGLINVKSSISFEQESKLPTIVNEKFQIINFINASVRKDIGIVRYQKIEDKIEIVEESTFLERVTYETLISNITYETSSYLKTTIAGYESTKNGVYNYETKQKSFYQPKKPFYLKKILFNHNNKITTGLKVETNDESIPNKKVLGITRLESEKLKDLIEQNNLINVKIYFYDTNYNNEEYYSSIEGIEYKVYNLFVIGESINGELKFHKPAEEITIYNIKGSVYNSNEYGKAIPDELGTDEDEFLLSLIDIDLTQNL